MQSNQRLIKNFEVFVRASDTPLKEREKKIQKWLRILLFNDESINGNEEIIKE